MLLDITLTVKFSHKTDVSEVCWSMYMYVLVKVQILSTCVTYRPFSMSMENLSNLEPLRPLGTAMTRENL